SPSPAPSPEARAAEEAARYRAALAYADSILLGRPLPADAAAYLAPPPPRPAAPQEESAATFEVTIGRLAVVAPAPVEPRPGGRRPAPRLWLQAYRARGRVGRL